MRIRARAFRRLSLALLLPATLTALGRSPAACAQESTTLNDEENVGYAAGGRIVTPVNQVLTPYGRQVDLPGLRPQALAISPNGSFIVTAGKTSELIVVDAASAEIRQRVLLPAEGPQSPARFARLRPRTSSG